MGFDMLKFPSVGVCAHTRYFYTETNSFLKGVRVQKFLIGGN